MIIPGPDPEPSQVLNDAIALSDISRQKTGAAGLCPGDGVLNHGHDLCDPPSFIERAHRMDRRSYTS